MPKGGAAVKRKPHTPGMPGNVWVLCALPPPSPPMGNTSGQCKQVRGGRGSRSMPPSGLEAGVCVPSWTNSPPTPCREDVHLRASPRKRLPAEDGEAQNMRPKCARHCKRRPPPGGSILDISTGGGQRVTYTACGLLNAIPAIFRATQMKKDPSKVYSGVSDHRLWKEARAIRGAVAAHMATSHELATTPTDRATIRHSSSGSLTA